MKRLFVIAMSLAIGVTATACYGTTNPDFSLAGTYNLNTIDGQQLPVFINTSGDPSIEVVSDQLVINSDGSYSGVTRYRDTVQGQQSTLRDDAFTGTWSLSGTNLTLRRTGGAPIYGTVTDNQMSLAVFIGQSVYYK